MKKKIKIEKDKPRLSINVKKAKSIQLFDANDEEVGSVESDNLSAPEVFYLEPGEYTVVCDGTIVDMEESKLDESAESQQADRIVLTSDAKDFHIVDGVGEILADGKSYTTISADKIAPDGKPLTRVKDNDELFIRTNAGYVKDSEGKNEIRTLKLKKGQASFRLYSEEHKRLATVQVISADMLLEDASLCIEFI